MKITCERTFPFKVVGSCPKPQPLSFSCPTFDPQNFYDPGGSSLSGLGFIDSLNRVLAPGNGADSTQTYSVLDFTQDPAIIERTIAGPQPLPISICPFFDVANNQIVDVIRTAGYTTKLCFFDPTNGSFSSITLETGISGGNVFGSCIVELTRTPRRLALAYRGINASGFTNLYIIDPVAKSITGTLDITAYTSAEGTLCYDCKDDAIILRYQGLVVNLINPDTLAIKSSFTTVSESPGFGYLQYIASTARIWSIGYSSHHTLVHVINPIGGAVEATITLPWDIGEVDFPPIYDFPIDRYVIAGKEALPASHSQGVVVYINPVTLAYNCKVTQSAWFDQDNVYPNLCVYRRSDGRIYTMLGPFDNAIVELS